VTVREPPALEKVLVVDPGGTEVAGAEVEVLVGVGGVGEMKGVGMVVSDTPAGVRRAVGGIVVVVAGTPDPGLRADGNVDDGALGRIEGGKDVVGTFRVITALGSAKDVVEAMVTFDVGMTESGGEVIALVTAPTPIQLTASAAAVAKAQATT